MPAERIGLNLSNMQNLTAPSFDFKNTTAEFLEDIPIKANEITGGFFGLIVLSGLFIFLYWQLSRESFLGGDFTYSNLRSLAISSSICSIMGLFALNMGYFTNYYSVVIFIVIAFIGVGVVWKAEK